MSFETRKQDAAAILRKWDRANRSPAAQARLIGDKERLWRMARDLAFALDNLYAHAARPATATAAPRARRPDGPTPGPELPREP